MHDKKQLHTSREYFFAVLKTKTSGSRLALKFLLSALCLVAIFPKILPQGTTIDILSMITAILVAFYVLLNARKLDIIDGLFLAMAAIILVATVLGGGMSLGIVASTLVNTLFPVFIRCELRKSNAIINILYGLSIFAIIGTLVSMAMPGVGLDGHEWYFVGGKNALAIALIPATFIILLRDYIKRGSIGGLAKVFVVAAFVSIVIGGSTTGMVGGFMVVLYALFWNNKNVPTSIVLIGYPIIQIGVWSTDWLLSQPIVVSVITDFFGKSLTFTHRSDVWQTALDGIVNSIFIGHGRNNGIVTADFPNLYEAHNFTLEVLLTGGIALMVVVILILVAALNRLKIKKERNIYAMSVYYIMALLIIGLMESIVFQTSFWTVIALATSLPFIHRNMQLKTTQKGAPLK